MTINGGKGGDKISLYGNGREALLLYKNGDGNDSIEGFNETSTLSISGATFSTTTSGNDIIVTVGDDEILLVGAADLSTVNIVGEKILSVTDKTKSPVVADADVKIINAAKRTTAVKITGNALNNSIVGGSGKDYLLGGKGNDTLNGGAGNDTLKGGAGNDVFIYTAGNDIISDWAAGDKISVGSAISNVSLKGSDVVFTVGKNTLTVKNGEDKKLAIINSKGKEYTTVISGAKTLSITNKTTSPVTLAADVGTADASKRTAAVKIVGNKLDNMILGGSKADTIFGEGGNDSIVGNAGNDKLYGGFGADTLKGGAGNDTLIGGAGNDSLWGDAGADEFIYTSGGGADVIFGFDNKDTLTLDTDDFTATYKNSAVTLKFESGSVVLKEFTATSFHIGDDVYKISGTKFVKK